VTNERAERMEEALQRIIDWCEAYEVEIFPAPDLETVRAQIGDNAMSRLHAAWARHLLSGIAGYAREGLRDD
jgi:hypothetical protein